MYPEGTFINELSNTIAIFEKDIDNPENEGFVCYWEFNGQNINKLIFKKRLSKQKAIEKLRNLSKEGWENIKENYKVA
tara:strand:- start:370 stop:603 length:234 start_codon:yes stop_codon:yes gene_type:complete